MANTTDEDLQKLGKPLGLGGTIPDREPKSVIDLAKNAYSKAIIENRLSMPMNQYNWIKKVEVPDSDGEAAENNGVQNDSNSGSKRKVDNVDNSHYYSAYILAAMKALKRSKPN